MDYVAYNRKAWDSEVERGNCWTVPVNKEIIQKAKEGVWSILVSPTKPIPAEWFPAIKNKDVLCLASGGGQQGPVLAAAGANVVVFDNSPRQLQQDQVVAERDSLGLDVELGDMQDLSRFKDESFDLIITNGIGCIWEISRVWKETFRILKYGGVMISGGNNPIEYVFDFKEWNKGNLIPRYEIPYSDARDLTDDEKRDMVFSSDVPLFFGHSLEDQIQGQIDAGFVITGFYDDKTKGNDPLSRYIAFYFGIRATKMALK